MNIDKLFKSNRLEQSLFKGFFVIWIIGSIVGLSLIAGVIWVAVHFVSKFW